jgi:TonB-linked SusC/RagA family outer membrane protein
MNNFLKTMHRCQKIKKTMHKTLIIMKISFIFLVLAGLQVHASVFSQSHNSISINAEGITIREAMKQIEKETDYRFFCSDDLVFLDRTTNLDIINLSIDEVLQQLFKSSDLGYRIFENNTVVVSLKEQLQQGIPITGVITDKDGEPLPGTAVVIKGTSQGTVTDVHGAYSLTVPSTNVMLIFSYIGYTTQEIPVGNQRVINITMSEGARELSEVVVVGYGALKKENLTGAVAQIKGDVLENRPVQYIHQALQGQVANLNIMQGGGGKPGTLPSINIRGYTGLGTAGAPLVVIDGIQGGDLSDVNMNDVESISVLKDAASAAIYGSSAPYGVIIINTKKGRRDKAPTISYSNNFSFGRPINIPKLMNVLDFMDIYDEACANAQMGSVFSDAEREGVKNTLAGKDNGWARPAPTTDTWMDGFASTDWMDVFFNKSAFSQQHNISASGGSEKAVFYVGMGYDQQNGIMNYAEESLKEFRVRSNVSSNLTKWLSFNFYGEFRRSIIDNPSYAISMHDVMRKWPNWAKYNSDGNFGLSTSIPLIMESGRDISNRDFARITGEFVVKPLPGWDITANYSYKGWYRESKTEAKTTWYTTPGGEKILWNNSTNSISRNFDKNQYHVINLYSSYEKKLRGHYVKFLLGFSQELYDNLNLYGYNSRLYSNDISSLSLTYNPTPRVSDDASQLAIRGGFGRINYNYQEKYLIELNGRYDGSSRFMKDVRMKFYPGVSAAYVLSKEAYWEPVQPYVNFLKIRASYGKLGDQNFISGYYPFYPSMGTVAPTSSNWMFTGGRQSYVTAPGIINQNLTWVTSSTFDVGADMAFLNNRLNVSFDWYKRSAKDYVGPAEAIPALLGAAQPSVNNSAMETKGIDLTIGWDDRILNNELHYSVNFVLSDYVGKITESPNPTRLLSTWYEGQTMGEIWGYETYGLFQSQEEIDAAPSQAKIYSRWTPGDVRYVDRNKDNEIYLGDNTVDNPGDKKIIGNSTPRFAYGLTLASEYKGFDFSIFAQGIGKRDAWDGTSDPSLGYDGSNPALFWGICGNGIWGGVPSSIHHDRWKPDNPDGYFPKMYNNTEMWKNRSPQTRYLQNAAYMRIKNLQIGYTLPVQIVGKINCQRARLFVSGENIATFTKMFKICDPEFAGTQGMIYPLFRTWAFGLNVTF